jgi:Tol biopolymer transport system component
VGVPDSNFLLSDRMPALSPDGSRIAFFQSDAGPLGDFFVIPTTGGNAQQLTFDVSAGGPPAWTPDGKFIVFSSERDGTMTLWHIAADGRPETLEPLTIGAGEDTDAAISGKSLIYIRTRLSRALTVLNMATGKTRELHQWRNQMASGRFSPDGTKIAFFTHESGGEIHISTIDSDGKNLKRVTWGKGERNIMPHWSSDGQTIYFYQTRPTISFRKIPVGGGVSSEVVNGWKWENESQAHVDSTGKRIVFTRNRNGTAAATVIRDLESGKEFSLQQPLFSPKWSKDDKFIVGAERQPSVRDGDIYVCPASPEACTKLTTGYYTVWSSDANTVFFLRNGDLLDGAELWSIPRKTGKGTHIANLNPLHPINHMFDVSPQGEVVFVRFDSGEHELWLADLSSR